MDKYYEVADRLYPMHTPGQTGEEDIEDIAAILRESFPKTVANESIPASIEIGLRLLCDACVTLFTDPEWDLYGRLSMQGATAEDEQVLLNAMIYAQEAIKRIDNTTGKVQSYISLSEDQKIAFGKEIIAGMKADVYSATIEEGREMVAEDSEHRSVAEVINKQAFWIADIAISFINSGKLED
jgi:hypothetical protein